MEGDDPADPPRWWGFVDEAIWTPSAESGCYILAAAVIETPALAGARSALAELLLRGQRRLHWRDESPARRRKIAAVIADIAALHVVVVGSPLDPRRQERARRKCLEHLLYRLVEAHVDNVALESRSVRLNAMDQSFIDALRARRAIPDAVRLTIVRPAAEPLLCMPDAIAGVVRAAVAGGTDEFFSALTSKIYMSDLHL